MSFWGVECALAVNGTGGPVKRKLLLFFFIPTLTLALARVFGAQVVVLCVLAVVVMVSVLALLYWRSFHNSWRDRYHRHRVWKAKRSQPPAGVGVTVVVTDIQASTLLWQECPSDMMDAQSAHDKLMR
eukprot:4960428-Pyramimonas_sp.AAC.3